MENNKDQIKIKALQEEIDELKQQLEQFKKNSQLSDLISKLNSLQVKNTILESKLQFYEKSQKDAMEGKQLKKTIFERVGGKDVIFKVVDTHYDRALENEKLGAYFQTLAYYVPEGMQKQKLSQQKFLVTIFGGPVCYEGRDMRSVHLKMHIQQDDYQEFVVQLIQGFRDVGVDEETLQDITDLINSYKKEILCQ